MNIKSYTVHLCMYSVVFLAPSSSFTWLCRLIFLDLTISLSSLLLPLPFSLFYFSLYATTKVPKQQFSIKIFASLLFWSCTLPVPWADGGLCLFLEGANTSLSFSGGKPMSSCTFLTSLERIKAIESSIFQNLSVLHRTEEVGGFGILLATTRAAGVAKCEVDPIFFYFILKLSRLNLERS